MAVYSAAFTAVAVSAAQDLFEIVAPSDCKVAIRRISIGQYGDAGDAQAELLPIRLVRGDTAGGSGGSAPPPAKVDPYTVNAAGAAVAANNTTLASTGGAVIEADTFNVQAGYDWRPLDAGEFIILRPNERFCVRLPLIPNDALNMNGTIVWEELGRA